MGYLVTILRDDRPILREEVHGLLQRRPDLRATRSTPHSIEFSVADSPATCPVLVWQNNEIWAKNPDRTTLQLMLDLAAQLGGRVRGDELETYRTPDDWYSHPADADSLARVRLESSRVRRDARRRQIALNAGIFGTFGLLAFLVHQCSR
jgi:hypothetical protein